MCILKRFLSPPRFLMDYIQRVTVKWFDYMSSFKKLSAQHAYMKSHIAQNQKPHFHILCSRLSEFRSHIQCEHCILCVYGFREWRMSYRTACWLSNDPLCAQLQQHIARIYIGIYG